MKSSANLMENPTFRAIKEAKVDQYKRVINTANDVLNGEFNDETAWIIRDEFKIYKVMEEKEHKYLHRKGRLTLLQYMATHKTIADVWWKLPARVRELWDANSDLLAWRQQYR